MTFKRGSRRSGALPFLVSAPNAAHAGAVRRAGEVSRTLPDVRPRLCGRYNVGDGPAAFLTLIIGALLIVACADCSMPLLAAALLGACRAMGAADGLAAVIYGLRVAKGALLASEHQREAAEGRVEKPKR